MARTRFYDLMLSAATIFIGLAVMGPHARAGIQGEQKVTQRTDSSIEKEVTQIEHEIFTAIKDKDPKRLDRILADDFVYRNPLEGERSRTDFLATIESIPVKILTVTSEDLKVNTYGEVAVVTGTQKATFQDPEGKEQVSVTAFVDVFVKRQGKWRLTLAHGTDLIVEKEK